MAKSTAREKVRLPIDERLYQLKLMRVANISEQIALEKNGAVGREPGPGDDLDDRARTLLEAGEFHAPPAKKDESLRLHDLRQEVLVIDRAIQFGESRAIAEHGERARKLANECSKDWCALQRKRALAIVELIVANGEIEDMRASMMSGGQLPSLPLDGYSAKLFGTPKTPNAGHWAREFLGAAVKLVVISQKEMSNV